MPAIPENGLLVFIDIEQPRTLLTNYLSTISPEDAAMLLEGPGLNMICENIENYLREAAGWSSESPDRTECKILPFKVKPISRKIEDEPTQDRR